MPIIQAYRRTKTHPVHFNGGIVLYFKPNERGDVVCDVRDPKYVETLLAIPTGFRLYEHQPAPVVVTQEHVEPVISPVLTAAVVVAPVAPEAPPVPTPPPVAETPAPTAQPQADDRARYVLVNADGTRFDLNPLTDEQLHAFAAANNVKVHPNAKGDTIRDKIVAGLKSE
jgi:hypothetical protein